MRIGAVEGDITRQEVDAVVNAASSRSAPQKIRTCPRSSLGPGEKTIVPSPSSTSAVTPSGVSATYTWPAGSRGSVAVPRIGRTFRRFSRTLRRSIVSIIAGWTSSA